MKKNYRITVIFKNEVIRAELVSKTVAKSSIRQLKELYPNEFISGALEEKRQSWEVIWVLGNDKTS